MATNVSFKMDLLQQFAREGVLYISREMALYVQHPMAAIPLHFLSRTVSQHKIQSVVLSTKTLY
jgi:hypothetical protein